MSMRGPLSNNDQDVFNALEHGEFMYQPDEHIDEVTPWRGAMRSIFIGIALSVLTFGFVFPDLLLNTASVVLMYLGFRSMRKENRWFAWGYRLTLVLMVSALVRFAIGSTIWNTAITQSVPGQIFGYLLNAVMLFVMLCVRQGIRQVQKQADIDSDTRHLTVAMAVYLAVVALPLLPWSQAREFGILGATVAFVWLLYKAYRNMGEAGYAIHPAAVKLSKVSIWLIAAGLAVVCVVTGFLFFRQYPMQWEKKESSVSAQAEAIREDLIALGMPQNIAADLSEADLLELEGAEKIYAKIQSNPNDPVSFNYVSVLLPDSLKLLVHFRWNTDDVFRGTETFHFEYDQDDTNSQLIADSCHGRLLYNKGSSSYASPYAKLLNGVYYKATGYQEITYVPKKAFFATFSMPAGGENCRGYLICDVPDYMTGPTINGAHQLPVPRFMYIYQEKPMILDDCQGVVEYMSSASRVIAPYFDLEDIYVYVPVEKLEH